jgi:hypothetical protein
VCCDRLLLSVLIEPKWVLKRKSTMQAAAFLSDPAPVRRPAQSALLFLDVFAALGVSLTEW